MKSFGPMHGERVRRHQFVAVGRPSGEPGDTGEVIFTLYEMDGGRLGFEVMDRWTTAADLDVAQARFLRDALSEYIEAWAA